MAILIALFLTFSMSASMMLIPNASAHTPAWKIPTYAYIFAAPSTIGVGQTTLIYMWLDPVYGAAGGTTAAVGTNGYTASAALLSNNYRFQNYKLTITAPNGVVSTQTWAIVADTTSNQGYSFTPTAVGTYNLTFTYPGQVYGAGGNGYSGSILVNDTYLPSSASTTLTVQQTAIPAAITSEPLPTQYWSHPIYGENSNWYSISSNWLGSGSGVPLDYTSSTLYHGDAIGPLTSHVMWTMPLQFGGVAGGNEYTTGGSYPGTGQGVQYYEGSSYQPRFTNPIIINGYLFYTEPVAFSGAASGPTVCVNLQTGQQLWSSTAIPPLSFGYVYNLWDPDQHGVFPPILVAVNPTLGSGVTGNGYTWQLYDAYTGDSLFNVTNIPSSTSFVTPVSTTVVSFSNTVVSTNILGPSGEALRYVIANDGTPANPQWYLSEWNMSKLWQYDINPYTGGGSTSPAVVNASNGVLLGGAVVSSGSGSLPPPVTGISTGTAPNGLGALVPYGSTILVNANIPIHDTDYLPGTTTPIGSINDDSLTTYDWNVSVPWLNTMPAPPNAVNPVTGQLVSPPAGANPVSILAVNTGDVMLCRNGSLPTAFKGTSLGFPQLPYTMFAVNLNATRGAIGSIIWMQTYNPPAGNITVAFGAVDFQTRVFTLNYEETMTWVGYSLDTGALLWGPTTPQAALDYYGLGNTMLSTLAYGNLYSSQMSGICYCYNDLTGALLWTYGNGGAGNSTYAGFNTGYGDYPTCVQSIANGVVYLATDEHTILNPIYKGATTTAINATTGQQIWQLSDYPSEWSTPGTAYVVADGYATFMNGYDNNIYSVGRGPSATTVQAPLTAITVGNNVVIQGTVMDIAAGTKQTEQAADFPNGVPCASDASMTAWMGYVYQQQAEPTNFTGVPVSIDAIDPNGNFIHIGNATSDANGVFGYVWQTPNIPGKYTVTATFAGTNGYWSSNAQTIMDVQSAPSATAAPTPAPASVVDTYFVPAVIAIIVVILIVGALLAILTLRKRP
jgi:hypothetical protein